MDLKRSAIKDIPSSALFLHTCNLLLGTYVLNSPALYNICEPPESRKPFHKLFLKRLDRKRLTPVIENTYNPQALSGVINRRNANLLKKGLIEKPLATA
ncbi:hypothetical protein [Methanosarcina sp.]|uniref:hypothetical protein n=1 Tax=Methanosarcina sp. TaxID=2213 RepID=UPI003C739F3A